ncbi:dihydroneopterin aldolase [Neisseria wadsworthii 9715]|uniref:Dihydroneopterin aldolase n=1 Tax=Neisseria wadsworthii 9715 TaxID=1030841 RepID=G4CNN8_9NEIS|nr:dihydroneopterin aldolase [Neisseria wadsworthii 9715]
MVSVVISVDYNKFCAKLNMLYRCLSETFFSDRHFESKQNFLTLSPLNYC